MFPDAQIPTVSWDLAGFSVSATLGKLCPLRVWLGSGDGNFQAQGFCAWQAAHRLSDEVLCKAVDEMCRGLVDASLGGELFKKRVAAHGAGKRGGYRTLLSARIGNRCVFLHGFAKSDKANITLEEQKALRFAGKVFLDLSPLALCRASQAGVLMEVCCEQQTD